VSHFRILMTADNLLSRDKWFQRCRCWRLILLQHEVRTCGSTKPLSGGGL
jgi:hypothetical protein